MTGTPSLFQRLRGTWARLRAAGILATLRTALAGSGPHIGWGVAFVVLMAIVLVSNPVKLFVFAWLAAKIIGAALIAIGLFRHWDVRIEQLEGLEQSMALTRRVTLMGVAILAAALTP